METLVNAYDVGQESTIDSNFYKPHRFSYTNGIIRVQCFFIMDNENLRKDVWNG